ncbi:MAG TPA: hypothetical protein VIS06_03860 [Mycobacteriales bacterium]
MNADLAERLADAPPEVLGRVMLAVATMHEPDGQGRCRWCRPTRSRWWRWARRGPQVPCPTRRVMAAELAVSSTTPTWTPA